MVKKQTFPFSKIKGQKIVSIVLFVSMILLILIILKFHMFSLKGLLTDKKNDKSNLSGYEISRMIAENAKKSTKVYGHPVDPEYTPKPTKKNLPRFSQFDPLSESQLDYYTYLDQTQEKDKIQVVSTITDKDITNSVKGHAYWVEVIPFNTQKFSDGFSVKLSNVPQKGLTEYLNGLEVIKNMGIKVRLENYYESDYFKDFNDEANTKEYWPNIYSVFDDIPLFYSNGNRLGQGISIISRNDSTSDLELHTSFNFKVLEKRNTVKLISSDQLLSHLKELKFMIFWSNSPGEAGENLFQGQVYKKINFSRIQYVFVPQSHALIPFFVVCGSGLQEENGRDGYFCALTEAVDYGD